MSTNNKAVTPKKSSSVPQPKGATGKEPDSFAPQKSGAGKGTGPKKPNPVIAVSGKEAPAQTTPVKGAEPAAAAQEPAKAPRPAQPVAERVGPRRVRLAVSRVDPWSVMKLSFLLSIAIGVMIVVASVVFWLVLDKLHVFTDIDAMIKDVLGAETKVNILQFVELDRVVSLSTIIAVVDVVLLTALGTIGAFLYNVVAALVGGIHLTMTDD